MAEYILYLITIFPLQLKAEVRMEARTFQSFTDCDNVGRQWFRKEFAEKDPDQRYFKYTCATKPLTSINVPTEALEKEFLRKQGKRP